MIKQKILLIEDDPDQILMYQNKFELVGFDFIAAENAESGLSLAKNEKPNIILLDLLLKELTTATGLEILKKLKEDQETKNIPVIVLTNFDTRQAEEESVKLGADDFIIKSKIGLSPLVERVKKVLDK